MFSNWHINVLVVNLSNSVLHVHVCRMIPSFICSQVKFIAKDLKMALRYVWLVHLKLTIHWLIQNVGYGSHPLVNSKQWSLEWGVNKGNCGFINQYCFLAWSSKVKLKKNVRLIIQATKTSAALRYYLNNWWMSGVIVYGQLQHTVGCGIEIKKIIILLYVLYFVSQFRWMVQLKILSDQRREKLKMYVVAKYDW